MGFIHVFNAIHGNVHNRGNEMSVVLLVREREFVQLHTRRDSPTPAIATEKLGQHGARELVAKARDHFGPQLVEIQRRVLA